MTRVRANDRTVRVACIRVADWPIVQAMALDPELRDRVFVVIERVGSRELVRAASPAARAVGVTVGLRRREAEARGVAHAVDADFIGEARAFEPVVRAIEAITPRVEIHEPGIVSFPTLGPSRYFGGDVALAATVQATIADVLGADASLVRVGVADGVFAARLAARDARHHHERVCIVEPGGSARFLADFPVIALGDPERAGLLERLGVPTLGDFANLPAADVLARFGVEGLRAHEQARGLDPSPPDLSTPPPDLVERIDFEPPITRVDAAAFAAKSLADRLLGGLAALGLGCVRVRVEAETEHGEQLVRVWRHEGALTPVALAERVRWQLDAWLAANAPTTRLADGDVRGQQDLAALADTSIDSTTGALTVLRLIPEEVIAADGRQLGFWGGDAAAGDRADRVLGRLQGMLGFEQVGTFVRQGGRTPSEQVRFVAWGEPREPRLVVQMGGETAVWPGRIPSPAPSRVFDPGQPAELLDVAGAPVRVSGRGEVVDPPQRLRSAVMPGGGGVVRGWSGPWIHDVRWWDPSARHRRAWFQLAITTDTGDDVACLVAIEHGRAVLDALY
jgi:protein ImuB